MSLTSPCRYWEPIWDRVHELPPDRRNAVYALYGAMTIDEANAEGTPVRLDVKGSKDITIVRKHAAIKLAK